jgi:hypothetical protein
LNFELFSFILIIYVYLCYSYYSLFNVVVSYLEFSKLLVYKRLSKICKLNSLTISLQNSLPLTLII